MKKVIYWILLRIQKPEEIVLAANSDIVWGKGYSRFFLEAFRKMDEGKEVNIPEKWERSPEGERYKTFAEFFLTD